jgi:hypothetical protein
MPQMRRVAVVVLALAGLVVLAAGVIDAVPLVFWGSTEEYASVEHGRTVMLTGAALLLGAAAAAPNRRASGLLAAAAVLPTLPALLARQTALGLLLLPVALGIGLAAVIAVVAGRAQAG